MPWHGDQKIAVRGAKGGDFRAPGWWGGVRKWAPKSKLNFVYFYPMLMGGKKFLKKVFTPLLCVQNVQRVMGIILRYLPPPPRL